MYICVGFLTDENFNGEFLVVEKNDVDYLKLRNVGRLISVQLDKAVWNDDREVSSAKWVDIIVLTVYDVIYLKRQIVIFDTTLSWRDIKDSLEPETDLVEKKIKFLLEISANLTNSNLERLKQEYLCQRATATKMSVYHYFREIEGYTVIDGQSMGVDFLLYESSADDVHAKYGLVIVSNKDELGPADYCEVIMNVRNLHSVKKKLLLVTVDEGEISYTEVGYSNIDQTNVVESRHVLEKYCNTLLMFSYTDKGPRLQQFLLTSICHVLDINFTMLSSKTSDSEVLIKITVAAAYQVISQIVNFKY